MATIRNLAELKARDVLEESDKVVFTHGGKELIYIVMSNALISDNCYLDHVFTALSLNPHEFASQAFGYKARNCISPCYELRDYAAATPLVEALYREIARQAGTDSEASYPIPPKKRTPGQQALISSAADVDAYMPLESDDRVFFQTPQGEFSVKVAHDHDGFYCKRGRSEPGSPEEVFTRLGEHDNRRYAETLVGERPTPGSYSFWPQYRDVNDFAKLLKGLLTAYGQSGEAATSESAEPELKVGDAFEFEVRGEKFPYRVKKLGHYYYASLQRSWGWSDAIFRALDIPHQGAFVEEVTGKHPDDYGTSIWPNSPTLADFNKVVRALRERCAAVNAEVQQPAGPRTFTSAEELRGVELKQGDSVQFSAGGDTLILRVQTNGMYSREDSRELSFFRTHGVDAAILAHRILGTNQNGFYPFCQDDGDRARLGDTRKQLCLALYEALEKASTPAEEVPTGPRTITNVAELRAAMPLPSKWETPHKVIIMLHGKKHAVATGDRGGVYLSGVGFHLGLDTMAEILGPAVDIPKYIASIVGYEFEGYGGVEVKNVEDLAKVIEDLMIRAGQGERPFVEGDIVKDSDGDFRRILAVSTDGQSFLLSHWHHTLETLNTADDLIDGSEGVSFEDLKESYTRVDPTPAKKVLTLTRQQIAEKFGVEPDQIKIEEAA